MAGGWQEGKEGKLTEKEGCVYKNEVILGTGPGIVNEFVRFPKTKNRGCEKILGRRTK
jgi:predicted oxidoreductase